MQADLIHDNNTIIFTLLPVTKQKKYSYGLKTKSNPRAFADFQNWAGFGILGKRPPPPVIPPITAVLNTTHNLTMQQQRQGNSSQTGYGFLDWYLLVIIGLLIISSNGLICYLYYRNLGIRIRPCNTLLLNQSCIDIFNGVLYIPSLILSSYRPELDALRSAVYMYAFLVSLLSLLMLAIERFWAISRPLYHHSLLSCKVLRTTVFITWLVPLPLVLGNLIWAFGYANTAAYLTYMWIFISLILIISLITLSLYILTFYDIAKVIRNTKDVKSIYSQGKIHIGGTKKDQRRSYYRKQLRLTQLRCALFLVYLFGYYPTLCTNILIYLNKRTLVTDGLEKFAIYS